MLLRHGCCDRIGLRVASWENWGGGQAWPSICVGSIFIHATRLCQRANGSLFLHSLNFPLALLASFYPPLLLTLRWSTHLEPSLSCPTPLPFKASAPASGRTLRCRLMDLTLRANTIEPRKTFSHLISMAFRMPTLQLVMTSWMYFYSIPRAEWWKNGHGFGLQFISLLTCFSRLAVWRQLGRWRLASSLISSSALNACLP